MRGGRESGPTLSSRVVRLGLPFLLVVLSACTAAVPPSGSAVPQVSAAASAATASAATALAPNKIQILHTNDIHGHLDSAKVTTGGKSFEQGGMALLGGMIQQQRARAPQRTIVLDAGDALHGALISKVDRGAAVISAMSISGYDAMAVGNHDLDRGQEELAQRAKEASFPFLAANLIDDRTGAVPTFAKPYIVKDVGIARVGVIGLTNPETSIINASSIKGLRFLPGSEGVRRYIDEVRRQADVIVVVSHLGIEGGTSRYLGGDVAVAQAFPDVDVFISGHDHQPFRTARIVGKTRFYETGSYAQNLGRVELTIDPATHKVVSAQGADVLLPVATGAVPPLPEIAKIVDARRAEADKYGKRLIGTATGPFAQDRDMNAPLGNLVADALLDYGVQQGWHSEIAFFNGAGVRAGLAAGDITFAKLVDVLPLQDVVMSVDLTGEQLKEVLEGMAGSAGRLFMSGGTMAYRFSNAPGSRVLRAAVAGQPLDRDRLYHVVTIDYLYGGGDGHTGFAKGTNVIYGDEDVDVVAPYIQAHSPISPKSPGRITQE